MQLVIQAGAMGEGGDVMMFDMGKSVMILDLAKRMIRLSWRRRLRLRIAMQFVRC